MDEGHSVIAASPRPGRFSVQCGSASPLRSASHCRADVGRQGRDLERRRSQSQLLRKVARNWDTITTLLPCQGIIVPYENKEGHGGGPAKGSAALRSVVRNNFILDVGLDCSSVGAK
ncbi:hypothetical protein KUCAC02_019919, partial [Chaenocephalus aceratus]